MTEPVEKILAADLGFISNVLVTNNEHVLVHIMNVSNDVKVIRAGTVVANLSPTEIVTKEHNIDFSRRKLVKKLPSYLEELLSRV